MSSTQLAASVRAFVDEVNAGDLEAVARHIAPEFYTHLPGPDEPSATQVWGSLFGDLLRAMPGLRVEIDELTSAEGDRMSCRFTATGTQIGTLWGAPPTGASVRWQTTASIRPANGRFAVSFDDFSTPDLLVILRQLELVNPPDQMDKPPKHPDSSIPDILLRMAFNGQVADRPCSHLDGARFLDSDATVCDQCVASGDVWPSLRMCLVCGFVGCCDTSKNTHMKRHSEETGHVLMRSIRLAEGWIWCYADNAFFDTHTLERLRARQAGGA